MFVILITLLVIGFRMVMRERVYENPADSVTRSESPQPATPTPGPIRKVLATDYHIFQSFNNCGPAALSMALKFYAISASQEELAATLRPYQVQSGDNDDKSVTLEELGEKAREYGLIPYHRPMGNPEILKQFIAQELPVITRTLLTMDTDIGHYRVVKGFDETTGVFIQDDSLQGAGLTYTFQEFSELWKKFNYEYLVLIPKNKIELLKEILKEHTDKNKAWQDAVKNAEQELTADPRDNNARFNLSVALFHTGDYQRSIKEFETVQAYLPFRTLWYQIEPIQSYYVAGNYSKVLDLTEQVLKNGNRAFSELYMLRGKVFVKQGNPEAARREFELALFYNTHLKAAQDALTL
jgi:hypothetical protein